MTNADIERGLNKLLEYDRGDMSNPRLPLAYSDLRKMLREILTAMKSPEGEELPEDYYMKRLSEWEKKVEDRLAQLEDYVKVLNGHCHDHKSDEGLIWPFNPDWKSEPCYKHSPDPECPGCKPYPEMPSAKWDKKPSSVSECNGADGQSYHNKCTECGGLFWTHDGFNTVCGKCYKPKPTPTPEEKSYYPCCDTAYRNGENCPIHNPKPSVEKCARIYTDEDLEHILAPIFHLCNASGYYRHVEDIRTDIRTRIKSVKLALSKEAHVKPC